MIKFKLIFIIASIVAVSGSVYFAFQNKILSRGETLDRVSNFSKQTEKQELDDIKEIINEVFPETKEQKAEQIGTGEITNDKDWILAIDLPSIDKTLFIKKEQWMEYVNQFDKELTELETKQVTDLMKKKEWEVILDDSKLSQITIEKIQNEYVPIWTSQIDLLKPFNEQYAQFIELIENQYLLGDIPKPFDEIYDYSHDMVAITDDLISLAEMNLLIKQETTKGISFHDLDKTITAANDEDKISLIYIWHEERFIELIEKKEYIDTIFEGLSG